MTTVAGSVGLFLDALNITTKGWATGKEAKFSCLNKSAHERGDLVPSAAISTTSGAFRCYTCGEKGGAYDLALLAGRSPAEAMELLKRVGLVDRDDRDWDRREAPAFEVAPVAAEEEFAPVAEEPARPFAQAIPEKVVEKIQARKGWSAETLAALGIGWDAYARRFVFPICDEKGFVGNVRYRPGADPKRDAKTLADSGVERNLFPPPELIEGDEVWVVEGEPDGVSLREIGLPGTGVPGTSGWKADWATRFRRFERVVIVADCDSVGRKLARQVACDVAALGGDVRILDLDPDRDDHHDVGDEIAELSAEDRPAFVAMLRAAVAKVAPIPKDQVEIERAALAAESSGLPMTLTDAADMLAVTSEIVPAVWGEHPDVLWAKGEALMMAGTTGVGKTTLAQQVILRRVGALEGEFLGGLVEVSPRPVLYLSLDRDKQAQRSMRRMVSELDRDRLLWHADFGSYRPVRNPARNVVDWVWSQRAGTVVVDSLYGLIASAKDDRALEWYSAFLRGLAARDIEVIVLHHFRKRAASDDAMALIDRLHGGMEVAASAGSIVAISGEPGDSEVEAFHVKQPAAVCGPWTLRHDHKNGVTSSSKVPTIAEYLATVAEADWKTISAACHYPLGRSMSKQLFRHLSVLQDNGAVTQDGDKYMLSGPKPDEPAALPVADGQGEDDVPW